MADDNKPSGPAVSAPGEPRRRFPFDSPVVMIACVILGSILVLILMAILDWDKGGVLRRMSEVGFARGLITYLFAVATIGIAVVLIVYALTPGSTDDHDFQHGKEILSLLLGVFGTIVGFYFGREGTVPVEANLLVAPLKLSTTAAAPGQTLHVTTVVSGGKAPLVFGIAFGDATPKLDASPMPGGWIEKDVIVPADQKAGPVDLRVKVEDEDHHSGQQLATVTIQGAGKQ